MCNIWHRDISPSINHGKFCYIHISSDLEMVAKSSSYIRTCRQKVSVSGVLRRGINKSEIAGNITQCDSLPCEQQHLYAHITVQ